MNFWKYLQILWYSENLHNMKVVDLEKLNNFHVGHFFIWALVQWQILVFTSAPKLFANCRQVLQLIPYLQLRRSSGSAAAAGFPRPPVAPAASDQRRRNTAGLLPCFLLPWTKDLIAWFKSFQGPFYKSSNPFWISQQLKHKLKVEIKTIETQSQVLLETSPSS